MNKIFRTQDLRKDHFRAAWLGYVDALGHVYNDEIQTEMKPIIEKLETQIIHKPYNAQSLLNEIINLFFIRTANIFEKIYDLEKTG